jgi:excisionase family DNA binding protein
MTIALRVREVAKRLSVTTGRVLTWIRAGRLRAIDVAEGTGKRHRWRITPEALAEFEATRTVAPNRPTPRRRRSGTYQYSYF